MIENVARPNCRGSWALGSACGKCPRCEATRPAIAAMQQAQEPVAWRDIEAAARKHGLSYRAKDNLAAFLTDIAPLYARPPVPQWQGIETEPVAGWIVGNVNQDKWRTWGALGPEWTSDRDKATRYARRCDAEQVHAEDMDAWSVVPFSPTPPNGGSDE